MPPFQQALWACTWPLGKTIYLIIAYLLSHETDPDRLPRHNASTGRLA